MSGGDQFIECEKRNKDAWICLCGNQPRSDGFYPCDKEGNEMEPADGWDSLYVCLRCGRIIEQNSLRVVGHNPKPKLLVVPPVDY
jgi:hypothetical protein